MYRYRVSVSVGFSSTGATTKSSEAVVSKGKGPQSHYSLMSSTPLFSYNLAATPPPPPPPQPHTPPTSTLTPLSFIWVLFSVPSLHYTGRHREKKFFWLKLASMRGSEKGQTKQTCVCFFLFVSERFRGPSD